MSDKSHGFCGAITCCSTTGVIGDAIGHRSTDGESWTSSPGTAGVFVGPVARSRAGTYAAMIGGWTNWYDKQKFYRSADGLNWETLPTTAFKQGHPITHVTFAEMRPSAECPLK